jgi:hypothetical protein
MEVRSMKERRWAVEKKFSIFMEGLKEGTLSILKKIE